MGGLFAYMAVREDENLMGCGEKFSPRFRGDSDEQKRGTPKGQSPYGERTK
jgi:hypothetical protein